MLVAHPNKQSSLYACVGTTNMTQVLVEAPNVMLCWHVMVSTMLLGILYLFDEVPILSRGSGSTLKAHSCQGCNGVY